MNFRELNQANGESELREYVRPGTSESDTTFKARPAVKFNVEDPLHRKDLIQFIKTQSWRHSAVRYTVDEIGLPVGVMQRKLLAYYISKDEIIEAF